MTAHIHGSFALWQYLVAGIGFVLLQCAAMDLDPLQQVINEAIRECLVLEKITDQQAASICGMSENNFRRALSGEPLRSLSLARLFRLPWGFWLRFGPMLMWMVAKKHAQEIADTFSLKRSAE
jgi:hypothetical protein